MKAMYAVVTFCGAGAIQIARTEGEGREILTLISARCNAGTCIGQHRLIQLGKVIT